MQLLLHRAPVAFSWSVVNESNELAMGLPAPSHKDANGILKMHPRVRVSSPTQSSNRATRNLYPDFYPFQYSSLSQSSDILKARVIYGAVCLAD